MKKPSLKTSRRGFQVLIAIAFIIIPILNRSRYSYVYGNFLSFHMFGIPLADPLAVLQLSIKNISPPTLDTFLGAFLPLLLACFMGTVFCSWVCPFGFLSELTQGLNEKIMGKNYRGLAIRKNGFPFKMTIFLLGLAAFFIFSTTPILNQLSLPAWYTRFFQYLFGQDVISFCFLFLLAVLLIEFLAAKRLWCRYICPQSILITLSKQLNHQRLHVVFEKEKCICKPGYERCEIACSLSLLPQSLQETAEFECSNCGDCIVACKKMGKALSFAGPRVHWLTQLTKKIQLPWRKLLLGLVVLTVLTPLIPLAVKWQRHWPTSKDQPAKAVSRLLDNKKLSWQGSRADYYEFLDDGTLICVGGDWPVNGFKGGRWEQVDAKGSFKMVFNPGQPDTYTLVEIHDPLERNIPLRISRINDNAPVNASPAKSTLLAYAPLLQTHVETATSYDATAVLNRYAAEIYVLDLRVQDPHGKIRKILTEGDAITTEVMLTNVKYWLNTPQIIVSEGGAPVLPVSSKMEILFFDDHKEFAEFSTHKILDRSDEEFDDPWF